MYTFIYYIIIHTYIGTNVHSPSNVTYLPGVTPLPIELTCDITPGVGWRVLNNSINNRFFLSDLANGSLPGHSLNGTNIVINDIPMNNTQYTCTDGTINGQPYYIFVAGEYADFSTATI